MEDLGYADGYKYAHDYPGHFADLEFMPEGLAGFCLSVLLCVACAGISILFVGCTRSERKEMVSMISGRIGR